MVGYRKYKGKVVLPNIYVTNTQFKTANTQYILLLRLNTQFNKNLICFYAQIRLAFTHQIFLSQVWRRVFLHLFNDLEKIEFRAILTVSRKGASWLRPIESCRSIDIMGCSGGTRDCWLAWLLDWLNGWDPCSWPSIPSSSSSSSSVMLVDNNIVWYRAVTQD